MTKTHNHQSNVFLIKSKEGEKYKRIEKLVGEIFFLVLCSFAFLFCYVIFMYACILKSNAFFMNI